MIIDFTVQNFLSFREEQTLSFVADNKNLAHSSHLLETPITGLKLLKVAVIYGPNASGKSNFLSALHRLKQLVVTSVSNAPNDELDVMPFRLDKESSASPTSFEINFLCNGIRYNYSTLLDSQKIYSEYLSYYPKKYKKNIFTRELSDSDEYIYSFGDDLKPKRIYDDIALKTSDKVLFLSKAIQDNSKFLKPVYDWFDKFLLEQSSLEDAAKQINTDNAFKQNFLEFIRKQDIDIINVDVDSSSLAEKIIKSDKDMPPEMREKILKNFNDKVVYDIQTFHKDSDGDLIPFEFGLESHGTHKLFALSPLVLEQTPKTFYVDELSSALHPLLVRNFLKTFHETTDSQMVCVTHDTHLIDPEFLRKDQIYFVEKDQEQSSSLYSLLEFNPRNDRENWELRYLSGRYGATPYLK
ncbi:ATP/GTP-binding protein [Acinetobacter sp. BSP-153]|uniref:AAA family ATPase n=1 Tax=Acinetobacter sp. BSP-153 TaxID=3344663 RepID=UPI00376F5AF1